MRPGGYGISHWTLLFRFFLVLIRYRNHWPSETTRQARVTSRAAGRCPPVLWKKCDQRIPVMRTLRCRSGKKQLSLLGPGHIRPPWI
eukprot:363570-Chlamydomonas_euryale.AAC.5